MHMQRGEGYARNASTEKHQRPIGVRLVTLLTAIQGFISVVIGVLILSGTFAAHRAIVVHGHRVIATFIDLFGSLVGGGILLEGVIALIFTWGLWTLQKWAFWATLGIAALILLFNLINLLRSTNISALSIVAIVLSALIILYFLIDPSVRRAFRM